MKDANIWTSFDWSITPFSIRFRVVDPLHDERNSPNLLVCFNDTVGGNGFSMPTLVRFSRGSEDGDREALLLKSPTVTPDEAVGETGESDRAEEGETGFSGVTDSITARR